MVDDATQNLEGSPSRDRFKLLHKKKCASSSYACDLDFILVGKSPYRIVAFLDYKLSKDKVTFSEIIAYNILKKIATVYIIRSLKPDNGPFLITRFDGGDPSPNPPVANCSFVKECATWEDFNKWEQDIRRMSL